MASDGLTVSQKPSFRSANAEDYDGVMKIDPNLYYGLDYLPARFHEYLNDPDRHLYVAETNGKVVGFTMMTVTDDGTTLSGQAGRVHADYRGRGVFYGLKTFAFRTTQKRIPTAKTFVTNTTSNKVATETKQEEPSITLFIRHEIGSETTIASLQNLIGENRFRHAYDEAQADSCTVLSAQQAQNLLENHEVDTNKIVPEGMWMVNAWELYGISLSNYKHMIQNEVVVSRQPERQQVVAISFSDFFKCGRGLLYLIHFYSIPREMESLRLIKSHYLQHLLLVKKQDFEGILNIWLLVPHDAPLDRIKAFLFDEDQLGMQRNTVPDLVDSTYTSYTTYGDINKYPFFGTL